MAEMPLFEGLRPPPTDEAAAAPQVYRVAQVNRLARLALEELWPDLWVEGELSNVRRAPSGHVYFTLTDPEQPAQVNGVLFRTDARRARTRLEDGALVRLRGQITVYEPRGAFQLVARVALPAGAGMQQARLEQIRKRLAADGLLDPARKRALPRVPRVLGVVTSAAGAAVRDIVRVAGLRCAVRVVVADCRVQGREAPDSIVRALQDIERLEGLDVVILGRGGGSQEDLAAFNDEGVARAIAHTRVPTISAVGHETDLTLADLVADVRASTPSNAAELAVPDRAGLLREVSQWQRRLDRSLETQLERGRLRVERQRRRLTDPRLALRAHRRALATRQLALEAPVRRQIRRRAATLQQWQQRVAQQDPRLGLVQDRRRLRDVTERLVRRASFHERRHQLEGLLAKLDALSPIAVLARGYAIVLREPDRTALIRAADVAPGDRLEIRVHQGRITAKVEHTTGKDSP